ncbi:MAG TPA: hypothetical protein VI488_03095 [Candidatus Angelobacter sp.]
MNMGYFLAVLGLAVAARGSAQNPHTPASSAALTHVSNSFEFTVHASPSVVAPLFGAHLERVWAEGWDPQFVYPNPPQDKVGAVFTVNHGGHTSTWITTIFDPTNGHVQYAFFIPGAMVTMIDIHVAPRDSDTHVQVTYERTALAAEANDHVRQLGDSDRQSAAHWQNAIESYLKKTADRHRSQ